tara:strand:- start:7867 stop:8184 length:318 start_codon:yes stop_codon:yes gene_type:complete
METQYEVINITSNTATRICYPQNNFTRILITNTWAVFVRIDLYVEDAALMPNAGTKYFILNQVIIPPGASLEIGEKGVPYFVDNPRELFIQSSSVTGNVTLLIRQ